ncbi:MAG: SDR family NAD(P)-dependent oxidoreductase, partial [Clostridia bacterium]|nr:SDR family NAD(P)-dependent oxidoreductase [Deltaproteobacteria bacterium]
MSDVIITGAGRGIGRALAIALDKRFRQIVVARTAVAAGDVVREAAKRGKSAEAVVGDLSTLASARALGERLCGTTRPGATLVHNAGIWPQTRMINADGFESAFVVNALAAIAMQAPLIARGLVKRILVVGTAMMVKGRFDAERTPIGADFSSLHTYTSTKLALAVTMQDVARDHPTIDVAVVHPGVIRTELGARNGFIGWLMQRLKKRFEAPEVAG